MIRVAFAWPGLTDYAARCIREVASGTEVAVSVVATRPRVPIKGIERSLGQHIHWISENAFDASWTKLGDQIPNILFLGGYGKRTFKQLEKEVRQAGGAVILMSDNNFKQPAWRRQLSSCRHRALLRRRFDGILVPGASGMQTALSWGYQADIVATGLYGADPKLFADGVPLVHRPKTFLFVGQFIARKNVLQLVDAFKSFAVGHPDWTLRLCGSGAQEELIKQHPQIEVFGFVQPTELPTIIRSARCLVLPSLEEHWGVVVHEAALCGCALALSKHVGAADDLASPQNAILFSPWQRTEIVSALNQFAVWGEDRWNEAERTSRRLALAFGPAEFAKSVRAFICKISKRTNQEYANT